MIGLHDVIFEGDAAVVINAISKGSANHSLYDHIVDDILGQASHLNFSEFCFVPCSCNAVADALAKRAKVGPDLLDWLEDCPENITLPLWFWVMPLDGFFFFFNKAQPTLGVWFLKKK